MHVECSFVVGMVYCIVCVVIDVMSTILEKHMVQSSKYYGQKTTQG